MDSTIAFWRCSSCSSWSTMESPGYFDDSKLVSKDWVSKFFGECSLRLHPVPCHSCARLNGLRSHGEFSRSLSWVYFSSWRCIAIKAWVCVSSDGQRHKMRLSPWMRPDQVHQQPFPTSPVFWLQYFLVWKSVCLFCSFLLLTCDPNKTVMCLDFCILLFWCWEADV